MAGARVFLNDAAGVSLRGSAEVFGQAGAGERIFLDANAANVSVDANIERMDIDRPLGQLAFRVGEAGLTILDGGTTVATVASLNQPSTLVTREGDVTITQTGAAAFEIAGADGGSTTVDDGGAVGAGVNPGSTTAAPPSGDGAIAANVFLDSGGSFQASQPVEVFGVSDGGETVRLMPGTSNVRTDANIERVELARAFDEVTMTVTDAGLELHAGGATLVTLPSLNQAADIAFADGAVELRQVGAARYEVTGASGTAVVDRGGIDGELTPGADPGAGDGSDGPQDLSVADATADEGNTLAFEVDTTNVADGAQVAWSLDLSGTAGDADINAATSGTVAVANKAATITIPTVQDVVNEGDSEALSLTVTSPDGTATASATGTIDDDDMDASDPNSTVGDLAVADASAVEGNDLGFRITSDELAPDAVVDWTIETLGASESDLAGPLSGTAVLGDDGAVTVDVSTVDDDIVESSENLRFAVAHTESGARDVARGSIADNDEPEPTDTFDLTTASATEGDDLEFIFTAPSASDSPRTFDWTVTRVFGGLEDSSLDTDQGQFTLPAGARETTVTVPTSDDTLNTTTTDVPLEITDPSSGDVVASNTGTIADDETAFQNEPFATISSAEATEGDNLVFDIALDRPAEDGDGLTLGVGNINFDIDDTANGVTPDDFTDLGSSDTVAFDDGQTTGQAVLETKDDDIVEGDETFDVSVSSLTVGSNDTNLTGTILDNDGMS